MAVLTKDEAYKILKKVLSYSKADACEVNLNGNDGGNIRYARNSVSTSGYQSDVTMVVQSNYGKKVGTATVNEFDDASLEKVVRRSEELAKLAPENPEFMGILGPQGDYGDSKAYFDATANISPEYRAEAAKSSIEPAKKSDITAAGYLNDNASFQSMANTKGLIAYHRSTGVNFTITMRTNDGTGSGWATRDFNDVAKFNAAEASAIAIEKSLKSRNPKALEPGKYTVILEPAATSGLLSQLMFSMGARGADEGRSFLSKKGGETKLGEKIVDERVTLFSDPMNDRIPSSPWAGDGQKINPHVWIENGVVKNLQYSRYWAEQKGKEPNPVGGSWGMNGGTASIDELIKDTKKGILVTNLWYIRQVDPQTLLYTGLTRDGTFYIENGKIAFPVKNFRFNESPVIMLNNLETIGQADRVNGALIPALKIRDFTFSSLSDAI
ncbi:MAG: TldD/PmbA family protein [Calditrichaeota bacterium]|nr:TldD/PmbA family protein [Calditrichota bacterium]